jgi:Leucine-rich repeat (LRR) protein
LRVLNLNSNRIDAVPPSLVRLTGLRSLLLLSNQVRMSDSDQQVLAGLGNLQVLDLSLNPIRRLPLRFDRLPELTTLRARGCGLLEVPDGIERCVFLRRLT